MQPTVSDLTSRLLDELQRTLLGDGSLWNAVAMLVLGIAVPLLIILGKQAIKQIRANHFRGLKDSFGLTRQPGAAGGGTALLDPTFDAVRYKYVGTPPDAAEVDGGLPSLFSTVARLFGRMAPAVLYIISVLVFAVIVAFLVDLLFLRGWTGGSCPNGSTPCLSFSARVLLLGFSEPGMSLAQTSPSTLAYANNTIVMLSFAFAGAYLWCVGYLIRRVNNFDLTPYSFLLGGMRILLTLAVALTIRHTIFSHDELPADQTKPVTVVETTTTEPGAGQQPSGEIPGAGDPGKTSDSQTPQPGDQALAPTGTTEFKAGEGWGWNIAILVAFLLGFYPLAGLDYLVQRVPELALKRPHPDASTMRRALPLDMIDGVTTYVQFRLEELEYDDVQNLATANPILLYVETPYNILEIIDWIAQAQLITAVGPRKASELRKLNVRTIFDLARIKESPYLRRQALHILADSEPLKQRLETASVEEITETFTTLFTSIADDLHVIRLARVWNAFYSAYQSDGWVDVATRNLLYDLPALRMETGAQINQVG